MISFIDREEKIKKYFTDNLPAAASKLNLTDSVTFIEDALDLDTYTKSTQLFFDFGKYDFQALSTESNSEEMTFTIYMTFKGAKPSELTEKCKKYAAAIYEMFESSGENFGGVVDIGTISTVTFYPMFQGSSSIKCFEVNFTLKSETN